MGRNVNDGLFVGCLYVLGLFCAFAVEEKPRCLNAVLHVTALRGQTAFLPCLVQGEPNPSYEWQKVENHGLLDLGSRYITSRKGLIIQDIREEDAGKYQVKLSNRITTHRTAVILKVIDGNLLKRKRLKSISENTSVSLSCGQRRNYTRTTIKWVDSSGNDVLNSQRYNVHINESLIISPTRRTDTGEYICKNITKSHNGDGTFVKTLEWYLDIQYEPQIIIIKPFISLMQNGTVLFPCVSIGNPTPTTYWKFQNGTRVEDNKKFKTLTNGSLLITNVAKGDALTYACVTSNGIRSPIYGETTLQVLFPPEFSSDPETNITVSNGDNIALVCSASGIPQPTTSWRHVNASSDVELSKSDEKLVMKNMRIEDAGIYICMVKSRIGEDHRKFRLTVKGKPFTPDNFAVKVSADDVVFSWIHRPDGGLKVNFELWYRSKAKTDFEWMTLSSTRTTVNASRKRLFEELSVLRDVTNEFSEFYCSVRAANSEGFSGFTYVILFDVSSNNVAKVWELADVPLRPYNLTTNISSDGHYTLKWKYLLTPGRPRALTFLVEYLADNTTSTWKPVPQSNKRVRRSVSSPQGESNEMTFELKDDVAPIKFRMYSVTNGNKRSLPTVINVQGAPTFVGSIAPKGGTDIVPPLILGVIFIFFFIILVISLYCFCRRKKRKTQGGDRCSFKDKSDLIMDTCSMEFDDESRLFAPKMDLSSPTLYHVAVCPALKLGKCSKKNDTDATPPNKRHSDDVYFLLEPHPREKAICTCNQPDEVNDAKGYNKKYKASTPTRSLSPGDSSAVLPYDKFDDEDFISEYEKEGVTELDNVKDTSFQRFRFKDSYDQFCRPGGNDFPRKVCARVDLSVLEKTEVDKNMDVNGVEDTLSENSVPESERRMKLKADDYNCVTRAPYSTKGVPQFDECNSSSSDPDSISFLKTNKNSMNGPENFLHNERSAHNRELASKRDIGYCSENTSRISPLFVINDRYHPPQRVNMYGKCMNYYSEDDALARDSPRTVCRTKKPPTYNQAIIDIERMSDRNDVTDSEEMYDKLLRMEKQLGVQLSDSLDSDLNARTLPSNYRQQHSKNSSDTGYISDIAVGSARDRYTYREKSVRCAQLLNEFKTSKPENLQYVGEQTDSHNDTSNSIIGDITELSDVAPILKRSNSTASNGTSHNEWLV